MNKKIVGTLVCMLILASIPIVAGTHVEEKEDALFGRTIVRGIILNPNTEGRTTSFFALRVHYTTYNLLGEVDSGVLILKRVVFRGNFVGYMGNFYISGTFRGTV